MIQETLKQMIEQRTGVPASLLTGDTAEEIISTARALLAYKKEAEETKPQTTKEQFAAWLNEGMDAPDETADALADIEEELRVEAGGYPKVTDAGETDRPDGRSTSEQFAEWVRQRLAYDPFKGGW